ncbi:MAG: acylphosphatase [Parcubacteria group bacterium]|nr:acylphosphatase [Parcubacteria group bacterium]
MKRVHIKIYGQVQGVFFRVGIKEKADELGIFGWARNIESGGVEIMAEGEKEKLEKLIEWARQGPESAEVEKAEVKWYNNKEDYNNFKIIY